MKDPGFCGLGIEMGASFLRVATGKPANGGPPISESDILVSLLRVPSFRCSTFNTTSAKHRGIPALGIGAFGTVAGIGACRTSGFMSNQVLRRPLTKRILESNETGTFGMDRVLWVPCRAVVSRLLNSDAFRRCCMQLSK